MDEKLSKVALWKRVRTYRTQKEIADFFGRDIRTVQRWGVSEDGPPDYTVHGLQHLLFSSPPPASQGQEFTFIDLFAGIGGMRLAFQAHGGKCVFTSEYDHYAQKTYLANFQLDHPLAGDITRIPESEVPDHDVLLAGFPCQPFSIAGVSKKNALGRKHGFECTTQGTLFFDIARIIRRKRPKAFLLENVKNLRGHDKGNTYKVIMKTLRDDLGYEVSDRVVDAQGFVPQHRERVFIVGFSEKSEFSWDAFVSPDRNATTIGDILHSENGSEDPEPPYTSGSRAKVCGKYILSNHLWNYLKKYAQKHRAAGNGFGYGLVGKTKIARTLSARYYKDGSEILVARRKGNPRRLTPRECSRLMGYDYGDRKFVIPVSDTRAYKQFGNGVAVPVVSEIARIMRPSIISAITNHPHQQRTKQIGLSL